MPLFKRRPTDPNEELIKRVRAEVGQGVSPSHIGMFKLIKAAMQDPGAKKPGGTWGDPESASLTDYAMSLSSFGDMSTIYMRLHSSLIGFHEDVGLSIEDLTSAMGVHGKPDSVASVALGILNESPQIGGQDDGNTQISVFSRSSQQVQAAVNAWTAMAIVRAQNAGTAPKFGGPILGMV